MAYQAWFADRPGGTLERREVNLPPLGPEEVEIAVEHCGICHSDVSMWKNHWGMTRYPAVFGHEAIGRVTALGSHAKSLSVGQRVGVGWNAGSCMHCRVCLSGSQHLCPGAQPTISGHFGGFASSVRSHWAWAVPVPDGLTPAEAGPLLCGGITVFNPLRRYADPLSRVGVIGIGGLGHLAVKFAAAFGCEVTAFTTSEGKFDQARQMGATHVVNTRDSDSIKRLANAFDLLVVTVNASLDWDALINTLAPDGRLHVVGAVLEPMSVSVFPLLVRQASVSASPTGSPVDITDMLNFAARHNIVPTTEHFPMSRINDAFEHLEAGKARYRIVLDSDF